MGSVTPINLPVSRKIPFLNCSVAPFQVDKVSCPIRLALSRVMSRVEHYWARCDAKREPVSGLCLRGVAWRRKDAVPEFTLWRSGECNS